MSVFVRLFNKADSPVSKLAYPPTYPNIYHMILLVLRLDRSLIISPTSMKLTLKDSISNFFCNLDAKAKCLYTSKCGNLKCAPFACTNIGGLVLS